MQNEPSRLDRIEIALQDLITKGNQTENAIQSLTQSQAECYQLIAENTRVIARSEARISRSEARIEQIIEYLFQQRPNGTS